ncbi:MAG TPA: GNAT family N-acetyltransferase [Gammaproteobacteria bacterium]|nr:GNAT family N-acetyltransferase [Gammaproteobacteria bacterium]
MNIDYRTDAAISVADFRDLLQRSTLAERRPIHDRECLAGMLTNSNLIVSAWQADTLVGIARSLTDFHYACYLSDLAVDAAWQGRGIGRELQRRTLAQLGPECSLILVAAPAANGYYAHLGYENHPRCWVLAPGRPLGSA